MLRLNPYVAVQRRKAYLHAERVKKQKEALLMKKRGVSVYQINSFSILNLNVVQT